jgi:hypothetical protein
MKRQRLKIKQESLQQEWNVRHEKLTRLRQSLVIQADANIKFQLEKEIQDEECEISKLEERLDEIEQSLNSCNSQTSIQLESESQPQKSVDLNIIPLESEKGLDYRKLRDLLNAEKWQEADKETLRVMLKAVEQDQYLNEESFEELPCKDLQTIDRLWVAASNGHFGFSVQRKIWLECGNPIKYNDDFGNFKDRVGWRNGNQIIHYDDLKFSLSDSPKGELPGFSYVGVVLESDGLILAGNSSEFGWKSLFDRVKICRL